MTNLSFWIGKEFQNLKVEIIIKKHTYSGAGAREAAKYGGIPQLRGPYVLFVFCTMNFL